MATKHSKRFPTCSSIGERPDVHIGHVRPEIEGYQISHKLGEGGMGVVWCARQLSTKRDVALKVMRAGFYSERLRGRFEREVELLARLNHPNIAQIYDSKLSEHASYYTMELVAGVPLDEHIKRQQLSTRETVALLLQVSQAVQHAHQNGIIHRDLKPSNILISQDGQPHVLDFGLAKAFKEKDAGLTVSVDGEIVGTWQYMSPEQVSGHSDQVDVRSDVYALGVIGYQLLTGNFPYDVTGSTFEVIDNIRHADPVKPTKYATKLDADLEAVLLKCLAKDPALRYQSVAELNHDLCCWREGLPVAALAFSSVYLLQKIITKHRYASIVVGLLLIIVIGFSIFSSSMYLQARQEKRNADLLADELLTQQQRDHALIRQITLGSLVDLWLDGNMNGIQVPYQCLLAEEGSREKAAVEFLFDQRPLQEKESAFRARLTEENVAFAAYIVGEHHYKDGDLAKAKRSFEEYQEAVISGSERGWARDVWISNHVRLRLRHLKGLD